jgi:hypothetical protein
MAELHDYGLRAFLSRVISVLERLDISYMIVRGFAATFYGQPRLTLDVDIVVDMRWEHVRAFVAVFPSSGYYVSEESILDSLTRAIRSRSSNRPQRQRLTWLPNAMTHSPERHSSGDGGRSTMPRATPQRSLPPKTLRSPSCSPIRLPNLIHTCASPNASW